MAQLGQKDSPEEAREYYFLKSVAIPGGQEHKYLGRYVRYTMGGSFDMVVTVDPPKFIKFFLHDSKSLAGHEKRTWGFVMAAVDGASKPEGCEPVQMFEDQGTEGFFFAPRDEGVEEVLMWNGGGEAGGRESESLGWKGWVLRESPPDKWEGNPQLFWMTGSAADGAELPADCYRVDLVREFCK